MLNKRRNHLYTGYKQRRKLLGTLLLSEKLVDKFNVIRIFSIVDYNSNI
jgi:hypothetical protein